MKSELKLRKPLVPQFPKYLGPESVWRCRDGRLIKIQDMESQHLLNTIRVLRGMSPIGTRYRTTEERRRMWLNAMTMEVYSRNLLLDSGDQN